MATKKMTFKHLTGSRAPKIDVIMLGAERELVLGRAATAAVRFDPNEDLAVGREHARITWTEGEPMIVEITDLKSRNGTFVNGVQISRTLRIRSGDTIQLGALGPEVEVKWEGGVASTLVFIG